MTAQLQRCQPAALAASALLVLGVAPCPVGAQTRPVAPLFAGYTPVAITLTTPVRTLVNRRASRPELDGTLAYEDAAGRTVALDVEVTTRGHSRLEICSFPPLSLDLRRGQLDGTLFAEQNRLKLVTLCRG